MSENQVYLPQQHNSTVYEPHQKQMDYTTNPPESGCFEPNYNHIVPPVNFYTQPNYTLNPTLYSHDGRQWTINNAENNPVSYNNVAIKTENNLKWSVQHPYYTASPNHPRPQHVLVEQNVIMNTPVRRAMPVPVHAHPAYHRQPGVIINTSQYKEVMENQDPNRHLQMNRNNNALTRQVESETNIAATNLTNVYNQDQFSEDSQSQSSQPSEPESHTVNKRTTRGRMRIYKRSAAQEPKEKNKSELIRMNLKGNPSVMESHGPSGDGEPPVKVQKISQISQPSEVTQKHFESYQISSNIHTLQPKHIISWYLDYLIGENEEITEMSKSFTIPLNIFGCNDFYYMDSLQKNINFPTPKFLQWMKLNFPSINVNAIDFFKKGAKKIMCDQKEYWKNKPPHDIVKEVFYHFQEKVIFQ